jgi:hypothetical protein
LHFCKRKKENPKDIIIPILLSIYDCNESIDSNFLDELRLFIDKKVIFDLKNVIRITFFPFNLAISPFQVKTELNLSPIVF